MKFGDSGKPADIQYAGLSGITQECINGVLRLIQFGDRITIARILSCQHSHGLLLTINTGDFVGVKTGFGSGYSGEGSRGLSFVLQLLEFHGAEIEEFDVKEGFLDRLDSCALTGRDLAVIDQARPIRPTRWHSYLLSDERGRRKTGALWDEFPRVMPFSLIDSRMADLALRFLERADDNLLVGYRRLEDIVRNRIGAEDHGAKLFSKAFVGPKAILGWKDLDEAESAGRANLFVGAYLAFRNPRAHRELQYSDCGALMEFLLLNQLYLLEANAIERPA